MGRDEFTVGRADAGPLAVSAATFETEVVERSRERPVVADFWAEWCTPCHMLAPVLEAAVAERGDAVSLVKVDVDAEPELALRFGVQSIPAVRAFRNGEVVSEFVGVRSPEQIGEFLDALAGPSEAGRVAAELREAGELPEVAEALERLDYETAFERLLAAVEGGDAQGRDRVRRLMVALFRDLGPEHPLAVRSRRRLATALY